MPHQQTYTVKHDDGTETVTYSPGFVKDNPDTAHFTYDDRGNCISGVYAPYIPAFLNSEIKFK